MTNERPIIFSGEMVRAILYGRKTQTRRIPSPYNSSFGSAPREYWRHADFSRAFVDGKSSPAQYLHVPCHTENPGECEQCDIFGWPGSTHRLWPSGYRGYSDSFSDFYRLWVRETWRTVYDGAGKEWIEFYESGSFPRDSREKEYGCGPWRPSIFMPRKASRITLALVKVRVERLQDITEEDAKAEGAMFFDGRPVNHHGWRHDYADVFPTAKASFANLWDKINGKKHPWASNPWVWVIEFAAKGTAAKR